MKQQQAINARRFQVAVIVAFVAMVSVTAVGQEEFLVPTDYATIQEALSAFTLPNGTVTIEDSEVYAETLVIPATAEGCVIKAAPGESPTIKFNGLDTYCIYNYVAAQLGSNDGGRIIIDGDGGNDFGGNWTQMFQIQHPSGTMVFENLLITNLRTSPVFYFSGSAEGDVVVQDVDIEQGNSNVTSFGMRIDFLNAAATVTFNRVSFEIPGQGIIYSNTASGGTLSINDSNFIAGTRPIFLSGGSGGNTINISGSRFHCTGSASDSDAVYILRATDIVFNVDYSVFSTDAGAVGFYMFMDSGGPLTANFDHCDFYTPNGFPVRHISGAGNSTVTLTNSILTGSLLGGPGTGDTFTCDYNDVVSGSYGDWPVGDNDISIDPGYTDPANGDFTYSDATVGSSDDTPGGPLGSAMNFLPVEDWMDY